jgi:hypothetical protein
MRGRHIGAAIAAVAIVAGCGSQMPISGPSASPVAAQPANPDAPESYAEFLADYVNAAAARERAYGNGNFLSWIDGAGRKDAIASAKANAPQAYLHYLAAYNAAHAGLSLPAPSQPNASAGPPPIPGPPPISGAPSPAASSAMSCPIGTHPWTDNWGNATCQSFETGQNVTTQANPNTGCPNGAMPSIDGWGNRTCQGVNGGPTYYNTSHGCPIGTHPWTDKWGNPTCQAF